MNDQKDKKYEELAAEVVRIARKKGADQAEVMIETGREFNATVRMGELDVLTEAGSKAMGIRVFRGSKKFLCYTSDFELESIENFLTESLALVGITGEDEHNGLPDESELADSIPDLSLCDSEVDAIPTEKKIAMAKTAEQAAFDYDPRIQNSSGADFTDIVATTILANSHGFTGSYRDSYVGLSVSPLIDINGKKQRDFWFTRGRKASELDDPVEVGKEAARRVLRRIDARQAETREVPVVFDPRMAASFIRTLFRAMSGSMVWRKQTFLADRLGEAIGSKLVTLVDDPLRPGDLGSRPFDGEGVRSRQNLVVEEGAEQLLHAARHQHAGRDHRLGPRRALRHSPDGIRCQLCQGGLLARCRRALDRERQAHPCRGRDHDRRQHERHAPRCGDGGRRHPPQLVRNPLSDHQDRPDDRIRSLRERVSRLRIVTPSPRQPVPPGQPAPD
jgi:PmbA protein